METGTQLEAIRKFREAGNLFTGEPRVQGSLNIFFKGKESRIIIGDNVTLKGVRFSLGNGGIIEIGAGSTIRGLLRVDDNSHIKIGHNTSFNRPCHLAATEGATLEIGSECLFSNATVRTSDLHSILNRETGERLNPAKGVTIEAKVWLGEQSTIMSGVRIGTSSIIGAGAIVTKSIPANCIAAGVPARVIKQNITWARDRYPLEPLPAPKLPIDAYNFDAGCFRQLIIDGRYDDIIKIVNAEHEQGNILEDASVAVRWYAARAMMETGCPTTRITSLLQKIVEERPNHKLATHMLNTLNSKR